MHLLPAAPSHQFNQEYTGALSPFVVPAQPAMGKGRGLTLGDPPATPEGRTACPAPAHVQKGFFCWCCWQRELDSASSSLLRSSTCDKSFSLSNPAHLFVPALGWGLLLFPRCANPFQGYLSLSLGLKLIEIFQGLLKENNKTSLFIKKIKVYFSLKASVLLKYSVSSQTLEL